MFYCVGEELVYSHIRIMVSIIIPVYNAEQYIDECYEKVDHVFEKRGIKKVARGVYQGVKSDFSVFMEVQWYLPDNPWFLKIVDEWYFRYEGDTIEYREDALESYYRVEERNANYPW